MEPVQKQQDRALSRPDVKQYLGRELRIEIDRPIGFVHKTSGGNDIVYTVNYGYIPGVMGGDGEEQDVYLLGVDSPVETYTGVIVGAVMRDDDDEDKLIMAPAGRRYSVREMEAAVAFQEMYHVSHVIAWDQTPAR